MVNEADDIEIRAFIKTLEESKEKWKNILISLDRMITEAKAALD